MTVENVEPELIMFRLHCLFGYDMCHIVCISNIDENRDAIATFKKLSHGDTEDVSLNEAVVLQKYFDFLWDDKNDSYEFVIFTGVVVNPLGDTEEDFERCFGSVKYPDWSKLALMTKSADKR